MRGAEMSFTGIATYPRRGKWALRMCWLVTVCVAALAAFPMCVWAAEAEAAAAAVEEAAPQPAPVVNGAIDLSGVWRFKGDWDEGGLAAGWQRPDHDDSEWRELYVPASWESQGILTNNPRWPAATPEDGYNGYAWYRRDVVVPADWEGAKVLLRVGQIWDQDWTYVNGVLVGTSTGAEAWEHAREYVIPPDALRPGEPNVIAVRVHDREKEGGIAVGPVRLENADLTEALPPAAGQEYTRTYQDIVRVGKSLTVEEDEEVRGDVVVIAASAHIKGHITGDVVVTGGSLDLGPTARIDGDMVCVGGRVSRDPGAVIAGEITEVLPGVSMDWIPDGMNWDRSPVVRGPMNSLFALLAWAAVVVLALLLFRSRVEVMAAALPAYPGRAAIYGIVGFALVPAAVIIELVAAGLVSALLAITIIGALAIPAVLAAAVLIIVGIGGVFLLGCIAVLLSLGKAVLTQFGRESAHGLWAALVGLLLIALVSLIPVVGRLVLVTVAVFGFGVAIMTAAGTSPESLHRRLGFGRVGPVQPTPATAPSAGSGDTSSATQPPAQQTGETESPPGASDADGGTEERPET